MPSFFLVLKFEVKFSLIYQGFYDTIYKILKRKERILEFSQVEWYAGENLQSTVF